MQISCERCNTVYVLDDKLIPPGGAPVQCTRCGLVFTAKPPPGGGAVLTPAPKPTAPPKPSPRLPTPQAVATASDKRSTQMFGAQAPAAAPPPSASTTMMFGAAATPPAPSAKPAPAASASSTMMFGAAATPPAPSAKPAPAASASSTMMFGAAPVPAPQPVQPPAPVQKSSAMTQVFGANAPAQPSASTTMMFGAPAKAPAPAPADASEAQTIAFGSSRPTASPPKAANSTMMFGAGDLQRPAGPAAFPPPAEAKPGSSTMMFGAAPLAAPPPQGPRAEAVEMPARPKAPAGRAPAAVVQPSSVMATIDESDASPHDEPLPPQAPAAPAPEWLSPKADESKRVSGSRPRAAPAPAPLPMPQAEPEEPEAPRVGSSTMELQASLKRRQRLLPIAMGAVVVALLITAAVLSYFKFRTPAADPALVAADGKAWDLLKQDDEESIQKAVESWEMLEAKAPEFVPLKANQLVAHVFLTQNLRDDIRRLTAQYSQLDKERSKLEEKKEPADWRNKANALREEMIKIKEVYDPLQEKAAKHDDRASELLKSGKALVEKLGAAGDGTVVFRASALYYASKGLETAEKLAEFYRKNPDDRKVLHDDARAVADLAVAGRFAQQRITPSDRDKAVAAAESALKKDPKLLRAHLFLAKIYLANKEYANARAAVSALLELNPSHRTGAKLKAEIDEAENRAKIAAERAEQLEKEEKEAEEKEKAAAK